jgi:hypothetical protein
LTGSPCPVYNLFMVFCMNAEVTPANSGILPLQFYGCP